MNQKLTLSVDSVAVDWGKGFAARNGTSLSGLVESFLLFLGDEGEIAAEVPVSAKLQSLIGIGSGPFDESDYRAHLEARHG